MNPSRVVMLLALSVLCVGAVGVALTPRSTPASARAAFVQAAGGDLGPEHKKLQLWVGDWTYQGEDKKTAFQPARLYSGKATARPMLGGAFVEWLGEDSDGGAWREIDGYDGVNKRYFWHAYYADGSVEVMTYKIEGNTVSLSGTTNIEGKQGRLRGTFVFAPDSRSFVEKLQVSLDGKTWIQAWEIRFARVSPPTDEVAYRHITATRPPQKCRAPL